MDKQQPSQRPLPWKETGPGIMGTPGGGDANRFQGLFGDPDWAYRLTSTKLWLIMATHLSESPIQDMKATDYTVALEVWVSDIFIAKTWFERCDPEPLFYAVARFAQAVTRFNQDVALLTPLPFLWWELRSDRKIQGAIKKTNQRYMQKEPLTGSGRNGEIL
ncbi:Dethiobiotin synthase BioD [Penicillium lividum]|nr:Dethiobiotin synthase BioD [Penicillium lividum]